MKIKILYLTTILLTLTFAFVVYASSASTKNTVYASADTCAMKDCCKDGKCSMSKEKDGKCDCSMHKMEDSAEHKCNGDCCKDGKCQMGCCKDGKCDMQAHKKNGESTAMKGDCCKGKDSCPMMSKGEKKDN